MISVIVPVYNVEIYLHQCLDSILNQTYRDIEVILVDDGCTDNSGKLCDDWALKDLRVKVIHQENSGVTFARKCGVEQACGKWVSFVDADDFLPLNALENLLLYEENADLIIGAFKNIQSHVDRIRQPNPKKMKVKELGRITYLNKLLDARITALASPCARLIRRKFFDDSIFDLPRSVVRGEDYIMNMRLAVKMDRIRLVDTVVYYYRQHPHSAIHVFKNSWEYEKNFLNYLFQPLYTNGLEGSCEDKMICCQIRSLGNAYHDRTLTYSNPDFLVLKQNIKGRKLGILEYLTLKLIYLPPWCRYLFYRIIRRIIRFLQ